MLPPCLDEVFFGWPARAELKFEKLVDAIYAIGVVAPTPILLLHGVVLGYHPALIVMGPPVVLRISPRVFIAGRQDELRVWEFVIDVPPEHIDGLIKDRVNVIE